MESKILSEFDVLKKNISTVLAPTMLDIMDLLGYEGSFVYYDELNGENKLYRHHLVEIIENPQDFFKPHMSPYDDVEDLGDIIHRKMLNDYSKLKTAFIALTKRKTEAAEANKWIDTLSIVYKRKVIIEKIKKSI